MADLQAVRKIYKVGSPWLKTDFYGAFTGYAKDRNLFTQQDFKIHGEHRRLVSSNFSEKWVKMMEPYIKDNVQLAIRRMAEEHKRQGFVDTLKWFMFMVRVLHRMFRQRLTSARPPMSSVRLLSGSLSIRWRLARYHRRPKPLATLANIS